MQYSTCSIKSHFNRLKNGICYIQLGYRRVAIFTHTRFYGQDKIKVIKMCKILLIFSVVFILCIRMRYDTTSDETSFRINLLLTKYVNTIVVRVRQFG